MGQKDSYSGGTLAVSSLIPETSAAAAEADSCPSSSSSSSLALVAATTTPLRDYTKIPTLLNDCFARDPIRAVTLKPKNDWFRKRATTLMSELQEEGVDLKQEKNAALDLLDGLTKSGVIDLDFVDLHIIVSSCHVFEQSVMNTLVRG